MFPDHLLLLMERSTHRNANILGLLRTGDDAAVVIGEHHHWLSYERRIKDPLTTAEEVVAVHQGDAGNRGIYLQIHGVILRERQRRCHTFQLQPEHGPSWPLQVSLCWLQTGVGARYRGHKRERNTDEYHWEEPVRHISNFQSYCGLGVQMKAQRSPR